MIHLDNNFKLVRRLVYACRLCEKSASQVEEIQHAANCPLEPLPMDEYTCQLCGHHGQFKHGLTQTVCAGCQKTIYLFKAPKDYHADKRTD